MEGALSSASQCKLDHIASKPEWAFPITSESVFIFWDDWMYSSISVCASTSANEP